MTKCHWFDNKLTSCHQHLIEAEMNATSLFKIVITHVYSVYPLINAHVWGMVLDFTYAGTSSFISLLLSGNYI